MTKLKTMMLDGIKRHIFWAYFRKTIYALIIGLIGSLIGAYFQSNSWHEQNELLKLESDRKRAEEIFSEVSSLMDDRFYKTIRLLSAYKRKDKDKIKRYKESFISQLEEWNSNRSRLNALIEGYFGISYSKFFMNNIQNDFSLCGNMLSYDPLNNIQKVDSITKGLQNNIFILNKRMIEAIKTDKIGRCAR